MEALGVAVVLGHAKVDNVYYAVIFFLPAAEQKVVRLDVTVDQAVLVERLNAGYLARC